MKNLYLVIILTAVILSRISAQSGAEKISTDSLIVAALSMVNADSLQANVQALQDKGTRFMIAPNRKDVATWIMNKFLANGITKVKLDSFLCYTHINYPNTVYDTTTWQYNVEARIEGTGNPEDEIVLLGHYDDFSEDSDKFTNAPGADDNASGTAATLECARVVMEMGYQPEQTMIFLADAAEELMYYGDAGTEHYAQEAQANGRNIVMAINNDMIAWDEGTWTLWLSNHTFSTHITGLAIDIIETYTSLNYETSVLANEIGGDIEPFLEAGYPGVYFMEHNMNPEYHSLGDTIENCSMDYLAEVTKVSLGCMLKHDITVGLKETRPALQKIVFHPNPASNEISFYISSAVSYAWDLKITDINGVEVYNIICTSGNNKLNISFLPEGFYLMIFRNAKETRFHKLMIVR